MKKSLFLVLIAILMVGITTASAVDAVTLGFFGPITGGDAAEGTAARNSFEMAIKDANASGEFPFEIKTIIVDDKSDAGEATAGAQKMVSDPTLIAATGHWSSGPAAASSEVFIENEIPFLIWGAIRDDLTRPETYPWITRSAPTSSQENEPLAKAVIDDMGYTKIFIISAANGYGQGNTDAWTKEMEKRGLEPVGLEEVQLGTVDFRAIIEKVKAADVEAVYWGGIVTEGSLLKQQMTEEGLDVLFCAISGIKTEDFFKAGAEAAEGSLVVSPGVQLDKSEEGKKFLAEYEAAGFSEPMGAYTPYSYEAALILLNALKTNCLEDPTPECMVDAIANSETTGIMGTTTFNDFGQTENVAAYLNVAQDGKWVPFDESEYADGTRAFAGK